MAKLQCPPFLTVRLSKTADGKYDYLQILSADNFALNIVLIADRIDMRDQRPVCPKGGEHEWGIDGQHSNEFCKKCFATKMGSPNG